MRKVIVEPAVIVIVHERGVHARAVGKGVALDRHIGERTVPVISIERLPPKVVDDVEVRQAIIVVVAPNHSQAQTLLADARVFGHIREYAVPIVVVELIWFSITRIESCGNALPWIEVPAYVEVEKSIIIVVCPSCGRSAAIFADS